VRLGRLYSPEILAMLSGEFGGARTVPALKIDGREDAVLWDTLAIAETLAERHPESGLWPERLPARALARALAAEMHSNFTALRSACPMNLRRSYAGFAPSDAVRADLARIETLWARARRDHGAGGPWLFGAYSLADAFFAPVAARVATYGLPMGGPAMDYVALHLADPAFLAWRREGLADPFVQAHYDLDLPERPWPGPTAH
jgi:glutathione S-transferase